MKQTATGLSHQYVTALRKHLKQGDCSSSQPALRLGRQAVTLGLETLDLARVHEQALARLETPNGRKGRIRQAESFFDDAVTPIMEMHRAARQSKLDLKRVNETLNRRTTELAATNRLLRRGIVRRKSMEAALKKGGEHHASLLKESVRLLECLRHLTHRNLSTQEKERHSVSTHLQNEIAQTLLGINVRLLNLKTAARGNTANLTKAIVSTQKLVEESVESINRFACELDLHQSNESDSFVKTPGTRRSPRTSRAGESPRQASKKPLMTRYPAGAKGAMIQGKK